MEGQAQDSRLYCTGFAGCCFDIGELTGEENENVAFNYFNCIYFCRGYFCVFLTSGGLIAPDTGQNKPKFDKKWSFWKVLQNFSLTSIIKERIYALSLQDNFSVAGWSSPVARQAHNLKVVGSNPAPATSNNI